MEKLLRSYIKYMELNKIYNEDCITFIPKMDDHSISMMMTSPPYNTSRSGSRYDETTFNDRRPQKEYIDWVNTIFNEFEPKLVTNGIIAWNVSYGGDGQDIDNQSTVWLSIASIIQNTPFTVAEHIVWKKNCCTPNSVSPNRLDRICEDIFIFCRKTELKTFHANKKQASKRGSTKQINYTPIRNLIEAPNNNESCPLNKATYSKELCEEIFRIYAPENGSVFDPFMGSGTTAVAAKECRLNYIGTEISKDEIDWAENRIKNTKVSENLLKKEKPPVYTPQFFNFKK